MNYKDAIFYVLSGTGNTYRVACWMADMFEDAGGTADLVMIDRADPEIRGDGAVDRLVGLLFPTHGFMAPWSMIKFLFKMPKGKGVSAVCVATRGCFKLGPVYIPGAAGFATFMTGLILFFKGYRIKGMFSLDMPANMINLHWGLRRKNVDAISHKARRKLNVFFEPLLAGKHVWFTRNNLWELAWTALIFWAVPLFPILYLVMGRIFMGKVMFSNNECIGCGLCAKACPNHGIVMRKTGETKRPFWTYHCEACLRCMGYCKRKAVEAGHSWAVILYFVTSIPIVSWLLAELHRLLPMVPVVDDYWIETLIGLVYIYPSMMVSYWLFWRLIRIPVVNTFFTYTTFTHFFKRRYHEPETKLKHMTVGSRRRKKGIRSEND